MTTPVVSALTGTPPAVGQPETEFDTNFGLFVAEIYDLQDEINAVVTWTETQVTAVDTDATAAASSASAAASSASAAASSAATAADGEAAAEEVNKRFLGAASVDPTVDLNGDPLEPGAFYFNTVDSAPKIYSEGAWIAAAFDANGALIAANNLSDLTNDVSARRNLGLGYRVLSGTATAASFDKIAADVSGGAWTLTLPASPETGDFVSVSVIGGDVELNQLTIDGGANDVQGDATLVVDVPFAQVTLVFNGTEWRLA